MNGIAIGAAIGGGIGLLSELSCGGNGSYCGGHGAVTVGGLIWGVGIGALVDGLTKTPRDVFRRGASKSGALTFSPVIGRRTAGGRVALRW